MEVLHFESADRFLEAARPHLERDVPRNQLILGIAEQVSTQPDVYLTYHGWVVVEDGSPLAAASCTSPYNFVIGDSKGEKPIHRLVEAISGSGVPAPGVIGNRPWVDLFVAAWGDLTGVATEVEMGQGIFALDHGAELEPAEGTMREADLNDRDLMIEWFAAFWEEAAPGEPVVNLSERIDQRLDPERPQGIGVWEVDGQVVSMSGYSHPVANSIRIGPVYTPPALRGRGYATTLVARQSQAHLDAGRDSCLLYTDLANPTSNAIYQRIGYRQVGESMVYKFIL